MGCCATRDKQENSEVRYHKLLMQKDKGLMSKMKSPDFIRQMKEEADKQFKAYDGGKNGSLSYNQTTVFLKQFCLKYNLPEPSKDQIKIAYDKLGVKDVNAKSYQELVIELLQVIASDEERNSIKLAK